MTTLTIGKKAPAFKALNENNELLSLAQYKGKKLVLYFYPKDDTPACTAEACSLRDSYKQFLKQGYEILGVSPDPVKKHLKFKTKHELPFSLLSDEDLKICNAYGVWGEKTLYGRKYMGVIRTTFVISETGKIERIISDVKTKEHAAQLLQAE